MARRVLMNEDQLKTWVMRQLGAPRVKVELDLCHLNDAFADALAWYLAYKGVIREKKFEIQQGQVAYDPPEDADTIIDVILPAYPFDPTIIFSPQILADEKVPYDVFAAPEAAGIYSSLLQALQYQETAKRILGAEHNWMWNEAGRKIILSPPPRKSGTGLIQYKSNCITVEQLNAFDHHMFKRYMLAQAKIILGGRIRGKYGSFPTAQGEREIKDADRMVEEAEREIEKLDKEIKGASFPMPFITG